MKTTLISLIILAFTFTACSQDAVKQTQLVAKDVSVQEFAQLMKDNPGLILDVRTKGEVAKGSIDNHVHLDIFNDNFESEIDKLDKNKPVYVYCAVGGRSSEAMQMMNKKGFKEVYNLAGGYTAWKKEMVK